jgi:hypothetical protein
MPKLSKNSVNKEKKCKQGKTPTGKNGRCVKAKTCKHGKVPEGKNGRCVFPKGHKRTKRIKPMTISSVSSLSKSKSKSNSNSNVYQAQLLIDTDFFDDYDPPQNKTEKRKMFHAFIQHKLKNNNNKYRIGDIIQYTEGDDRDKCILVLEKGDFKEGEMDDDNCIWKYPLKHYQLLNRHNVKYNEIIDEILSEDDDSTSFKYMNSDNSLLNEYKQKQLY